MESFSRLPSSFLRNQCTPASSLTGLDKKLICRSNLSGHGQLAHFAQIGRQLGYAGYFATDQMLWLAGVGVTRPTKEYVSPLLLCIPLRRWNDTDSQAIGCNPANFATMLVNRNPTLYRIIRFLPRQTSSGR